MTVEKFEYSRANWTPRIGEPQPSDKEIKKLAIDIRDNGLRHPILIAFIRATGEFRLIDGLKRIKAHQLLDWSMIDATVTTLLDSAVDEFVIANEGRELSWHEAGRIVGDFDLMFPQRVWAAGRRIPKRKETWYAVYGQALGKPTQHIRWVRTGIRAERAGDTTARSSLTDFYEGKSGIQELYDSVSGRRGRDIPSKQAPSLVKNVQRTLITSLDQMNRIVDFSLLSEEELDEAKANFRKIYNKLSIVTRRIRGERLKRTRQESESEEKEAT